MAQELRILLHCDRHAREEQVRTGDGVTVRVAIDGEEREAELCPPCVKELVTPLREAMRTYGRRPKAETGDGPGAPAELVVGRTSGRALYRCPVPGCEEKTTGLRRHVGRTHGSEATRTYLPAQPGYRCPEPGCMRGQPGEECAGTVGLAVHARQAHGNRVPVHQYIQRHKLVPV